MLGHVATQGRVRSIHVHKASNLPITAPAESGLSHFSNTRCCTWLQNPEIREHGIHQAFTEVRLPVPMESSFDDNRLACPRNPKGWHRYSASCIFGRTTGLYEDEVQWKGRRILGETRTGVSTPTQRIPCCDHSFGSSTRKFRNQSNVLSGP